MEQELHPKGGCSPCIQKVTNRANWQAGTNRVHVHQNVSARRGFNHDQVLQLINSVQLCSSVSPPLLFAIISLSFNFTCHYFPPLRETRILQSKNLCAKGSSPHHMNHMTVSLTCAALKPVYVHAFHLSSLHLLTCMKFCMPVCI